MAVISLVKATTIWAGGLLLGLGVPYLPSISSSQLNSIVGSSSLLNRPFTLPFIQQNTDGPQPSSNSTFACETSHTYRTELVSLEPLIIYIHNLITPLEISSLLKTAEPRFQPSEVTKSGRHHLTSERTSNSAGLPRDDPAVMCVLNRTRSFLGTMLRDDWDEMGPPQLVRYTTGQKFNSHHDWYDYPQWAPDGSDRKWNRVASFFAILQDNCTGGETYFPYAMPIAHPSPRGETMWQGQMNKQGGEIQQPLWREHQDGGLAFRPVAGNAVFWVNLHTNGTGDERTIHAGLPLESGLKTAMNIWPRQFYAYP